MLTIKEIKKFIADDSNSVKKKFAKIGQRYYGGDHDIKDYKLFYVNDDGELVEDTLRSNIKIPHPFFQMLSDQTVDFIFQGDENLINANESMEESQELQKHLDEYFNDEFWNEISEMVQGSYNKGFEYLYCFKNEENRMEFACSDCLGVIEIKAKEASDKQDHTIYWYVDKIDKDGKECIKIQDWCVDGTYYYVQEGTSGQIKEDENELQPRPNILVTDRKTGKQKGKNFGYIPFFRFDYNSKQISALKPIKKLIDDYDLHACSLSNNLKDFDQPIYVAKGYPGEDLDKLQINVKAKKMIAPDETGGLDVLTVDIPYQARKEKLAIDRESIFFFGFGLDTTGLKDTAATTNLAIEMAYSLLILKANKVIKRLKSFLNKHIIPIVLDEINEVNKTAYTLSDVYIDINPTLPINRKEQAETEKVKAETKQVELNTLLNAAAHIDDDTMLKNICDVLDLDYEDVKDKLPKEDDITAAKNALGAIEIDGVV